MRRKTISIIGGGIAGIVLAAHMDSHKYDVTIYEKNKALGRKFLVAGDGGLNLSYDEPVDQFRQHYIPSDFLAAAIQKFTQADLRNWLASIGIDTYVSPSRKIFPVKGIKPIQVLRALLQILGQKKIHIHKQSEWKGWNTNQEVIINDYAIKSDIVVFALGGSSWKVTGSDGHWLAQFAQMEIPTLPFQASNCAFGVNWPSDFTEKFGGLPLKNITATCDSIIATGEIVITQWGIEGKASYALSHPVRNQMQRNGNATIYLDLKPTLSHDQIFARLQSGEMNTTRALKEKLKLNKAAIGLLKQLTDKATFIEKDLLAKHIKALPIPISSLASLDEAISTVGGVDLQAVDPHYQLHALPNQYCIGEMLDWDAPTGGYLLHGCMSMGGYLANYLNRLH